jgi:hypothetical protein
MERVALATFLGLAVLLGLAWILEELLRRTAQAIEGFVPVADRLGEVGVAWQRLRAALQRARARWRSSSPHPSAGEFAWDRPMDFPSLPTRPALRAQDHTQRARRREPLHAKYAAPSRTGRTRAMERVGLSAEQYVVQRINELAGWSAINANDLRSNQPGFDVLARSEAGREVRVSVKSKAPRGSRHDYEVGKSFRRHPADLYAFVNTSAPQPWSVYLAGARSVVELALVRHEHYQRDRGRDTAALGSWAPKVSHAVLEAMDARERWSILDEDDPANVPPVTPALRAQAERDTPSRIRS